MQRRFSCLLFSLLVAPASFGQIGASIQRSVSGYIREESTGHVIASARVELQSAMGSPLGFTYSDGNGVYQFSGIAGNCYVAVQRTGYADAREFIEATGSPDIRKDIFLRPLPPDGTSPQKDPVSQHELSVPPKARESFDKGVQLVVQKSDYRGAIAQFSKAIAKFPDYYEAYAAMGLAQSKVGDAAAAEASLRKSIAMSNEKYAKAMIDLGSLLNTSKRFSDAEPLLRSAVTLDGTSWRAEYELAGALAGQNRYKDAVFCASTARDLKPDNPPTYVLLYNLHIETDNFQAALQDADSYLKLVPDGPMAARVRKMREQLQKGMSAAGASAPPQSKPF